MVIAIITIAITPFFANINSTITVTTIFFNSINLTANSIIIIALILKHYSKLYIVCIIQGLSWPSFYAMDPERVINIPIPRLLSYNRFPSTSSISIVGNIIIMASITNFYLSLKRYSCLNKKAL